MQFPLEAQAEFWKQMVTRLVRHLAHTQSDGSGTVRTGTKNRWHRAGQPFAVRHLSVSAAVLSTKGVAGIVSIEPAACPDRKDDMAPFKGMPILVLFGDYVDQSPRWAPRLKLCRDFVQAVNAAGGKAELTLLPDIGIHGNSHMLMQDKNSLAIADWLVGWINHHIGQKP